MAGDGYVKLRAQYVRGCARMSIRPAADKTHHPSIASSLTGSVGNDTFIFKGSWGSLSRALRCTVGGGSGSRSCENDCRPESLLRLLGPR